MTDFICRECKTGHIYRENDGILRCNNCRHEVVCQGCVDLSCALEISRKHLRKACELLHQYSCRTSGPWHNADEWQIIVMTEANKEMGDE